MEVILTIGLISFKGATTIMKNRIFDFCFALGLCMSLFSVAHAQTVVLAVPGPGNLPFLPVYLAKAIEADHAEGLELKLRYLNGGPLAMRDLMSNNSDFAVIGLPAIAAARADNMPVIAIGQLSQSAMFVLLLRAELKGQVHSIAELKGRRIGTASSTKSQRSMGQMMTEFLIQNAGLQSNDVQFIATGLNRESQRAALASASVDAIMGDEPFASELVAQGLAVRLADLYPQNQSSKLLGGSIIRAALSTREDVSVRYPQVVRKVQRMFERTLHWMSTHSAQEIVDKLANQPGFDAASRRLMGEILQNNKGIFPNRLTWDAQAVATTESFFHSMASNPKESQLPFADFVRSVPAD
jgi:NitT/TauT family transport system substrate-binding protein